MKKFLLQGSLFCAVNLLLATGYLWSMNQRYTYHNWDTESVLLPMPKNEHYDLVILGASHGRVLSSYGNHKRVEQLLDKRMFNLSKTAAGIIPEKILLSHFFQKKNQANQIVYILDPPVFYSDTWNEKNFFLEDEPLNVRLFLFASQAGLKPNVLLNYVKAKFSPYWITKKPLIYTDRPVLEAVDKEAVSKRLSFLYEKGQNRAAFERYFKKLEELIDIAKRAEVKFTVIFPPTLLGELPGTNEIVQRLYDSSVSSSVKIANFSTTITEPRYYMDHDHLNPEGMAFFTAQYLKPLLDQPTDQN